MSKSDTNAYVPAWLVRQAQRAPASLVSPGGIPLKGAVMMADVSGFTRLAEQLRAHGSEGAEILWRQVDGYFGRMLEIIRAHGGEVLRFPGDAAIVLFEDLSQGPSALTRAASCGLALQENLGTFATEDGGELRMRVAIAAGEILAAWVGGSMGRWEAIVVGDPIRALGPALKAAEIGQVVVSGTVAQQIPSAFITARLPAGHLLLVSGGVASAPLPPMPAAEDAVSLVRPFVPNAVLTRVDAGHDRWLAELRNLNVIIASVHGIDEDTRDPTETVDLLQRAFSALQGAVYKFGGSVNLFLQDDKGIIMVAAWGLPGRAHEDDPVRAVRAAMGMRAAVEEVGLAVSIGVAQGKVFCGQRGGSGRLEYGVLGSPVNLAARLASQTVGGILCDPAVQQLARLRVRFSRGPELALKGLPKPIQTWLPTPADRESTRVTRPIFGRETELDLLGETMERLEHGTGGTIIIEGEPGIGKSSLIRTMGIEMAGRDLRLLRGAADAIDRQSAYHAFRGVYEDILGLKASQTPNQRLQQAASWLEAHAAVGELAPLFGPLLRVGLRDNARTAAMVGQARAETAIEAYVAVLATLERPVVVVDDIQWLDSASWQLLKLARAKLPQALFVLTTRPAMAYPSEAYDALMAEDGVMHMVLGPLDRKGIEALLRNRLGAERLASPLSELVLGRCEGLPFYAEEMAMALRDAGQVHLEDGEASLVFDPEDTSPVLPQTLEGVITSRIDRLSATQQLALKTASVVGRSFLADCVHDIYPVAVDGEKLADELDTLVASDLIEVEAVEPALAYRFKHIITQEVAYELLLFEQRRNLHQEVAEWLESGKAGAATAFAPRIAWHWRRTGDAPRAIDALETAGEQAFGTFAEREAVDFLSAAMDLAKDSGAAIDPRRRAHWLRVLGEARMRLGLLEGALQHLTEANSLLGYPVPQNTFMVVLGLLRETTRQLFRFKGWSKPRLAPDPSRDLEAANAHLVVGDVSYFLRNIPLVLFAASRGLNLAQDAGPSPDQARAQASWAIVMSSMALHGAAETYSLRAVAMAEQFEDPYSLGNAQHYRGIIELCMARPAQAVEVLSKAQVNYSTAGNGRRLQEATISIIFTTVTFGDFDRAEAELVRFREIVEARSDDQARFWGVNLTSEIAWRRGSGPEILLGLDESQYKDEVYVVRIRGLRVLLMLQAGLLAEATVAAEPLEALARPTSFIESLGYFALFQLALEQRAAGVAKAALARKRLKQLRGFTAIFPMGQPLLSLAEAQLTEQESGPQDATKAWTACLTKATELGALWEQAEAHRALARLDTDGRAQEHQRAWQELSARLGISKGAATQANTA